MIMSTDTVSKQMGERIRDLRKEKGWTQRELADRLGVHAQTVSDAERGRQRFTVDRLFRFFGALGYDAEIELTPEDKGKEPPLETVRRRLKKHKETFQTEFDVKRVGIFGSVVRGDSSPGSDVDIFVEFQPGKEGGGIKLQRLRTRLKEWLDRPVDLVPSYALSDEEFRGNVQKDILYVD